jgi:Integrase core domain
VSENARPRVSRFVRSFLKAAVTSCASLGVTVARVMTDNGSCYKAFDFRDACRDLGLKHLRTRPDTPKTNGKAERFIQSALREWAYAQPYTHSDRRTAELPRWLHRYNWHRPQGSLDAKTPIGRLGPSEDNLLSLHSWSMIRLGPNTRSRGGVAKEGRSDPPLTVIPAKAGIQSLPRTRSGGPTHRRLLLDSGSPLRFGRNDDWERPSRP